MKKESKTIHEAFSRFFEKPTRETLRALLKEHVGELRNCDFKESWPDHSGLARHVLGLGNSGGGCIVVGVKENADKTTEPIGLASMTDKVDITNGLKNYVPSSFLNLVEIADFRFEASEYPKLVGKIFQVIFVHFDPNEIPFVATKAGSGIRAAAIYVRREGGTEEASYDELQRILSDRIGAAGISQQARDLKEHFEELKILYNLIPRTLGGTLPIFQSLTTQWADLFGKATPNPDYPSEDYQTFVRRILDAKKKLIESLIGVSKRA